VPDVGFLLLEVGAEFGGAMSEPDLEALERVGGLEAPVAILPTAAAPDNNQERAGRNGVRWFHSLGASHVDLVPVIDKASANDPFLAGRVRSRRLIYLLGGFPRHLAESLRDSLVWQAALQAYADGAVIGGSSAGAMVLCKHYYDPQAAELLPGLNLLPACCILPHHNTFGARWSAAITEKLPASILIGLDEQTGILNDSSRTWSSYGAGQVTLYRNGQPLAQPRRATFRLDESRIDG
jgi:cyanophycinase